MSAKQPPRLAIYLLEAFAASPALTGDVIERYARGRSRFWFWRQTLIAIAIGAVNDIRDHKWLFARAVFVGILAINILARLLYRVGASIYGPVFSASELRVITVLIYLFAGWLIGRSHRPFGASMTLGTIVLGWFYSMPFMLRNIANVLQHDRFRPYVYGSFLVVIESTICLLIGAMLGARRPNRSAPSTF